MKEPTPMARLLRQMRRRIQEPRIDIRRDRYAGPATIHVVLIWFEELKRLTATEN